MARRMSNEHKEALRKGRAEGRSVREYLAALEQGRRPGRPRSAETITSRIAQIQALIDAETDPAKRVDLIQKRLDQEYLLIDLEDAPDLAALEQQFIKVAKGYSERKGITYPAWREAGVSAAVLKQAGIARTRRPHS